MDMSEIGNPQGTDLDTATAAFAAVLTGNAGTQEEDDAQPVEAQADAEEVTAAADEADAEIESDVDEESDENEEPEPLYPVKVDGKSIEVPLSELLNGYSRTADYYRKTEAVANTRKEVEAQLESVKQERAQYAQLLGALEQQVRSSMQAEPNWAQLRAEDPIEYAAQWAEYQQRERQFNAMQAEQQRVSQLQQAEQAQQMQQVLQQQAQAMVEAIPEWRDSTRAANEKKAVAEYAQTLGFSADELAQTYDHRAVVALRKAYLYDQIMARKATIKPAATLSAAPLRPGTASSSSRTVSDLTRAKQRLAQTGKVSDAAAAFRLLI